VLPGFRHLKPYVGIPLTVVTFFLGRNLALRNSMDKIYFPLQPLYEGMRAEEKKAKLLAA
jgi:hypothetical protein